MVGLKKGLVGQITSKLEELQLRKAPFFAQYYTFKHTVQNMWIPLAC